MRPPHTPKAVHTAKVKVEKSEALALREIHHSTLVFVDFHMKFAELLPESAMNCVQQPRMAWVGVHQDHEIISEARVLNVRVLALCGHLFGALEHLVYLVEVQITQHG